MYKINSNIKSLKELPVSGIYQIKNVINNKIYIGSAENFDERKKSHFNKLRKGKHANIHLQRAYDFYGENSFVFSIIEYVKNKSLLLEYEQYFLDYFKMIDPDGLYNICIIAGSRLGMVTSEDTKRKISIANKGKKRTEEQRVKMLEVVNKMWTNEDLRKKTSERAKGNKNCLGRRNSDEQKKRMSDAKKGMYVGSKSYNATITESIVAEIKEMIRNGIKDRQIWETFNISKNIFYKIKTGRTWKHVE